MNPKFKRFADEYLVDCNATQAAIRAGYSEKTAGQIGYQLLHNTSISAYLKEKTQSVADKLGIDAEFVLRSIRDIGTQTQPRIARANPAVSLKAFETLGKHLKLFDEDDKSNPNIVINIVKF